MAIRIETSISLRSEFGVTFGKLLKASDKQLTLDSDTKFRPGSQVEFQLELRPRGVTIYGLAQVTRVTASTEGPSRYLLVITQLGAKDRRAYQEWLYDLAQTGGSAIRSVSGTTSAPALRADPGVPAPPPAASRPPGEYANTWSAASSFSGSRQNVGRAAVREALRARFAGRGAPTPGVAPAGSAQPGPEPGGEAIGRYGLDAAGVSSTLSSAPHAGSPSAARQARSPDAEAEFSSTIRTVGPSRTAGGGAVSITASPDAEAQFASRPPATPSGTSTAAPPASGPTASPAAAPPGRKLEVTVSTAVSPPTVHLKYNDPARFLTDYADYLSKGAAFVRWSGAKPDHRARVSFVATLPRGGEVRCEGDVVALLPSGFGLSLHLGEGDRAVLAAEARIQG